MANNQRFGRLVEARRRELGMSQSAVREAGGPSALTVRRLEHGDIAQPDFVTFGKLDQALQWMPGSAGRAFQGGEPTPISEDDGPIATAAAREEMAHNRARPAQPVTAFEHGVVLRTDALAELTRNGRALDALPDDLPDDVQAGISELRYTIDRLTRAWIIRLAESFRKEGNLADLVIALDDHLRSNPSQGTAEDIDDLRYLRWLAGYYQNPSDEERERYERRFARSQ
ncbi:helix-turn-helix domain-containing protein [Gordonia sp. IITR100]|uniref:helix-turn-helix domain-containing protein n=1 Tax=Gordonia sp. IITR100 TaxID=1314686 RepID=UPI0020CA6E7F|nr:helix-turn-helix domain-containing protein [Gordonia sp. IITR100]